MLHEEDSFDSKSPRLTPHMNPLPLAGSVKFHKKGKPPGNGEAREVEEAQEGKNEQVAE